MGHNISKYDVKIALFFTIGLIALFFCFGAVRYEVNDDMGITSLVKGLYGRTPSAEGVFLSPLLGGLLFFLYKLFPAIPWFSLFLYTGVALAFFLGSLTILLVGRTVGGKGAGLLGVAFFISLTAFQINFAAVSLLLWITGCAYIVPSVRRKLPQNIWFWLASSSLAAAYLLRPSLLLILILLALPMFLTLMLAGRRVTWCALSPLIMALTLNLFSGMVIRGDVYSEYKVFNKIRGEFHDTSRASWNSKTPQALVAAHWSKEDYIVSKSWWLHDSTFFNTEQISTFLDKNGSMLSKFNIENIKQNISRYAVYLWVLLAWILVLLLASKPHQLRELRGGNLFLYFFLIAVVLLLMGIRFPQRVAYPCFLMLFLNSLIIFDDFQEKSCWFFLKIAPPLLFIIFLTYSFVPIASERMNDIKQIKETKKYIDQSLRVVLEINGPDSIIVNANTNIPPNYLPFQENDPILKIRLLPGGWSVGTPVYLDFLKREGLGDRSTAVASMIDNRRVVLRFWESEHQTFEGWAKNIFLKHLRQRYTISGSERYINLKIIQDHRQGVNGLVYFQLVTVPLQPPGALL